MFIKGYLGWCIYKPVSVLPRGSAERLAATAAIIGEVGWRLVCVWTAFISPDPARVCSESYAPLPEGCATLLVYVHRPFLTSYRWGKIPRSVREILPSFRKFLWPRRRLVGFSKSDIYIYSLAIFLLL